MSFSYSALFHVEMGLKFFAIGKTYGEFKGAQIGYALGFVYCNRVFLRKSYFFYNDDKGTRKEAGS